MDTFIIRFFFFYFLITLFPGVWSEKMTLNGEKSSEPFSNRYLNVKQVSGEIEWVHIESGKFLMGSTQKEVEKIYQEARIRSSMLDRNIFSAETPQRWVTLSSFEISKYEVTNAQYYAFVIATGRPVPRGYNGEPVWENPALNQAQQPVVGVTWYDAQAFAEWVGGSLPTEAQWERAARGKNGAKYPWGNESPRRQFANFAKRQPSTTPVGQFPLGDTDTGISDLAGNVWEWCLDDYSQTFYQIAGNNQPVNTQHPNLIRDRVIRGGSWDYGRIFIRSQLRFKFFPLDSANNIGFRIVKKKRGIEN